MVFRLLPRPLTAARIAIEMPDAMSPYSIAVAPDSLNKNFAKADFKLASKSDANGQPRSYVTASKDESPDHLNF
jgi:hypothetical protein